MNAPVFIGEVSRGQHPFNLPLAYIRQQASKRLPRDPSRIALGRCL